MKESKEYWYICSTRNYEITRVVIDDGTDFVRMQKDKEIGNYFETIEEAEKAVEKLKAFKRLEDKGFRFVRIDEQNEGHRVGQYIEFEMAYHFTPDARQIGQDLDLLFGGEE